MTRHLCLFAAALAISASTHAYAAGSADSTCGSLDATIKLVLEGYRGEPFRELNEAQVHVARAVLLDPASARDARALAATRVLVSRTDLGEAAIFVDGDQACSFGLMPPGTVGVIDALKDKPMVEAGTQS